MLAWSTPWAQGLARPTTKNTLGRKMSGVRVLPRISAALSNLVTPIASNKRTNVHDYREKDQQNPREKRKPPKRENGKLAEVIPFQKAQPPRVISETPNDGPPDQESKNNQAMGDATSNSVTQTLLQIFAHFSDQKVTFMKWLGVRSYNSALRSQKKGSHIPSGTILDRKAE